MAKPQLTFSITGQPGFNNKLSRVSPYNKCTCKFSCDQDFEIFMCRVTKDGDPYGKDTGTIVYQLSNRSAGTEFTFEINSELHMLSGDGLYRFGMYAKNHNGEWNVGSYFLVHGGGYFLVGTGHDKMIVKD